MKVECAAQIEATLGEGPIWSVRERCLYWFDMYQAAIYRYRPTEGTNERLPLPEIGHVGGLVPRARGGLVMGAAAGLVFYDPVRGTIEPFVDPRNGRRDVLYNDAKADRFGRLWISTYHEPGTEPRAALYRIDPYGRVSTPVDRLIVGNGPAFAPDGRTLYIAETMHGVIYAYDLDPESGAVGSRRLFAEVPSTSGFPDGMTVDHEGGLWNAHYGGGRITRYHADGRVDLTVAMPVPFVTSCMFGGPDLSTLYVTSASSELSPSQRAQAPLSGSLFAIETPFEGLPEPEFSG